MLAYCRNLSCVSPIPKYRQQPNSCAWPIIVLLTASLHTRALLRKNFLARPNHVRISYLQRQCEMQHVHTKTKTALLHKIDKSGIGLAIQYRWCTTSPSALPSYDAVGNDTGPKKVPVKCVCVCVYECASVCLCICQYVYACTRLYKCVCVCMCMCVHSHLGDALHVTKQMSRQTNYRTYVIAQSGWQLKELVR